MKNDRKNAGWVLGILADEDKRYYNGLSGLRLGLKSSSIYKGVRLLAMSWDEELDSFNLSPEKEQLVMDYAYIVRCTLDEGVDNIAEMSHEAFMVMISDTVPSEGEGGIADMINLSNLTKRANNALKIQNDKWQKGGDNAVTEFAERVDNAVIDTAEEPEAVFNYLVQVDKEKRTKSEVQLANIAERFASAKAFDRLDDRAKKILSESIDILKAIRNTYKLNPSVFDS
jgi:hypothetical protein